MHIYIDRDVAVYESPTQYSEDESFNDEGDEFTLLTVEVIGANTYKIIDGVPRLIAIAQAIGTTSE